MTKKDKELEFKLALAKRLRDLRAASGLSAYQVSNDTSLPASSLLEWERGEVTPNILKLTNMAEYYGVSLDYLVGRSDETHAIYKDFNFKSAQHRQAIELLVGLETESAINSAYTALDAIASVDKLTQHFNKEKENK